MMGSFNFLKHLYNKNIETRRYINPLKYIRGLCIQYRIESINDVPGG
ncbi:hypothetical protein N9E82_00890 [bacterium]|nr:hypothetical protein [bacterium]